MSHWNGIPEYTVVVTEPAREPVSRTEAKNWLKAENITSDDTLIDVLITAARRQVEQDSGLTLVSTTFDQWFDRFPTSDWIPLSRAPVVSVTSLTSYDEDDVAVVKASTTYLVDTKMRPGRLVLNAGEAWPTSLRDYNAGVIRFVAGFADTSLSVSSITRSGSAATVTTASAHGYTTGKRVTISGATQPEYNGAFDVTVTSTTAFTCVVGGSPATPATGTITAITSGIPGNLLLAMRMLIALWHGDGRSPLAIGTVHSEMPLSYGALVRTDRVYA